MPSQSETAYQALREAILSARVLPGEHLPEIKWATALQVGRFAIREALRRLHGEGLLMRVRGKYRVTVPNAADIHEIVHLRSVLETGAVRFLPDGKISTRALAPIRRAASDYAVLVKKGYLTGAREADLRFHEAIIAASQNPRLISLYKSSNLPVLQVSVGKNPSIFDDFVQSVGEHAGICAALTDGKINRAAQLLEKHLKRGERTVLGLEPKH